jgi:hypothetical protein
VKEWVFPRKQFPGDNSLTINRHFPGASEIVPREFSYGAQSVALLPLRHAQSDPETEASITLST